MESKDKQVIWFHAEVKTPPFSKEGRIEAGVLFRRLQGGEKLSLPHSRHMPNIGSHCHELRIPDGEVTWRIFYRIDKDAIVVVEVIAKKTPETPKETIKLCKKRLKAYDDIVENRFNKR